MYLKLESVTFVKAALSWDEGDQRDAVVDQSDALWILYFCYTGFGKRYWTLCHAKSKDKSKNPVNLGLQLTVFPHMAHTICALYSYIQNQNQ